MFLISEPCNYQDRPSRISGRRRRPSMSTRAARLAAGSGAVTDRTSEPHPGLGLRPGVKWQRVFPGEDSPLRLMRQWLRSLLPCCPVLGDVLTVATQLATNAICHPLTGQAGWFAVEVPCPPQPICAPIPALP